MLLTWAKSPSRTVLWAAWAFLGGVVVHAIVERPWAPPGAFLAAAGFLLAGLIMTWRWPRIRLAIITVLAFTAAAGRYEAVWRVLPPFGEATRSMGEYVGTVTQPVRVTTTTTILTLAEVTVSRDGVERDLPGRFRLRFSPPVAVPVGTRVAWRCRPSPLDDGPDQAYFMEGVVSRCRVRGPPEVLAASQLKPNWIERVRQGLRGHAAELWPEPEGSFMLGLLLGDRDGIPWSMTEAFRETGTSHILAVSGYNISRVVGIAMILAAGLRLKRRWAAVVAAGAVIGFAALVGGQASVIRAALMGCFGLLAVMWARQSAGGAALWVVAAAMLYWSPLALKHDVGFQLSFAAVWGLGAFGPRLAESLEVIPATLGLRQAAAETLAATLATLPIIMLVFGRLPLIGPLVNLVILPLIPIAMFLGFGAILLAMLHPWLAWPVAWVGYAILWLVGRIVTWSAALGFWAIEAEVGLWVALAISGWLVLWAWAWSRRPVDRAQPETPVIQV
jgi:ComEC/Rec2-related protein